MTNKSVHIAFFLLLIGVFVGSVLPIVAIIFLIASGCFGYKALREIKVSGEKGSLIASGIIIVACINIALAVLAIIAPAGSVNI